MGIWRSACKSILNFQQNLRWDLPERTRGRPGGRLRVRIRFIEKKRKIGSFILLHKTSRTACCFGIRTFLKQYSCYEIASIWYTDHQYLAQYSEIINNLPEMPLIFCNYAVRSCGTWRKGPGQSPCNVLSISDLELYVTETGTGVVNHCKQPIWRPSVHRMCHKDTIFGLYTEYQYRNNAKMARTGRYGGSERWKGTVIIEIGD